MSVTTTDSRSFKKRTCVNSFSFNTEQEFLSHY